MKLQIPQNPNHYRVLVSVIGPDITKVLMVSSGLLEVDPDLPENTDERLLTVTAQFIDNARNPVGDKIVLQEAEEVDGEEDWVEDLDEDQEDWDEEDK